jgi:hypothetical protein
LVASGSVQPAAVNYPGSCLFLLFRQIGDEVHYYLASSLVAVGVVIRYLRPVLAV